MNSSAGERIAGSEKQPVHCTKRIGHFTQHSSMIGHQFFSANQVGTGVYTGVSSLVFHTLLVWLGPAINSFRPISATTPRPTGSTLQMYGNAGPAEQVGPVGPWPYHFLEKKLKF